MKSQWQLVYNDLEHHIAYIEDMNLGARSVTNDAERVYQQVREWLGPVRVVYKDSDGCWTEIEGHGPYQLLIRFRPWHGLVWDILSRK